MKLSRGQMMVDPRAILPVVAIAVGLSAGALVLPIDRRLAMEMLLVFAMAQGWNLLCGYTGLLSFGHHAFVGLGAYALILTVNALGISPYLSLGASALVCVLVALVMVLLLHRMRDAYFSIGIWVLADSLRLLFGQWEWAGSSRGVVLDASAIDPAAFADNVFWLALALALTTQIGTYVLLRSRIGLALMAIRDNENGAASVGIAVARNRLAAFVISAAICGLAGGLYYLSVLYVDPSGGFDIDWQIKILFIVMVGGAGTLEGPVLGTLIYFGLRELFRDAGDLYLIFQGATAMIVMLLAPNGIWGSIQARTNWRLFSIRWTPGPQKPGE
ncbi:branched-chain amino acid ABC transporter permease [Bradyrhizobium sp. ORS 375]|uniref:branched-chain amino acid ABC transporter permease n=1 Tax=Bradyrhizobium sp. (strain ORS 375) TaxID=566679 RepID=UPI0002D49CC6|nr:branched-chain amino acid ABC transporter permease [Bradyrhizobium sp. ORS 375]